MSSESRKPVSRKTDNMALFLMSSNDLPEQALNSRSISFGVSAFTILLSGFGVLRYLNGDYAELEDRSVYGKLWFKEGEGLFHRRGKRIRPIYYLNIGTIPDETHAKVFLRGSEKKLIGTLDEAFLQRLKKGDLFVLGGKLYRFCYTRGMNVYVDRSFAAAPTVPSWFSEQLIA